ncbi:MAG TPA: hypothetical protein VME69_08330 [Methylocella sp.]|nr:hypothetical protein [Methylocella sp.]
MAGFDAREFLSPPTAEGKRGSLDGPTGTIHKNTLVLAALDRAASGGRRMLHLPNERFAKPKVSSDRRI